MPDWLIMLPVKLPSSEPRLEMLPARCSLVSDVASAYSSSASSWVLVRAAAGAAGGCIAGGADACSFGRGTTQDLAMPGACTSKIPAVCVPLTVHMC